MNPELVKQLMESPMGQALRDFIIREINKIDKVSDINQTTPEMIALDTRASQVALKALHKMFDPLIEFSQFDILNEKDDSISSEMLLPERSPQDNQS